MTTDVETQAYRQYRFKLPPDATEILLVRHGETIPFADVPFPLVDGQGDPEARA